jgi:hypothetical protein
MRAVSLLLGLMLAATPVFAQPSTPIRASLDRAAASLALTAATDSAAGIDSNSKSKLFWTGLAVGLAGLTTSVLGVTVFRVEDSSTGNAPRNTYQACVAQRNSDPTYATNQCDALKAKNLKMLWGGAALGGVGAAMMIGASDTSAQLSGGVLGVFHRVRF